MKTALILLSLLLSTGTLQKTYAGELKTKNISGKIIDSQTDQPLDGVNVTLENDNMVLGTLSNHEGEFRLWRIPETSKSITISLKGYQSTTVSIEHIKEDKADGTLLIELEGALAKQKSFKKKK